MNYNDLTKKQIISIHKDALEYIEEREQRIDKLIEYIKDYLCSYDYTSGDLKEISNVFIRILETLKRG